MSGKPMGHEITDAQWDEANEYLPPGMWCEDPEEVCCVLAAVENEEHILVNLSRHRFYRSPAGRRQQAGEEP